MKFKVTKGTETFKKLVSLMDKVKEVDAKALKVVKKLGGKEYAKAQRKLAGGIAAIQFKEKPDGYKVVGETYQSLFYPKATNKEALKLINELPTVEVEELNDIVGFKSPQTVSSDRGLAWITSVGLVAGKSEFLIEVAEGCSYKPKKDIIEILDSEYKKKKAKIESSNK